MNGRRVASIILVTGLAAAGLLQAQTVELAPTMDATLYEDAGGNLANGSGSYLFVGRTAQPLSRRALLAFDIAGSIPAGATIVSVELQLQASKVADTSDQTIRVHQVTESWGEGDSDAGGEEGSGAAAAPGDATWIHRMYPDSEWMQAGGSFAAAASAERTVGGLGSYTWDSTPQLVGNVQDWLDNPGSNFGWILVMAGSANGTAKRFNSRENGSAGTRPRLHVEYQISAQPPAADFSWSPPQPTVDEPVQFTDASTGNPTSWMWDFGDDGGTSTEQSPIHSYAAAGAYTVMLTVTNAEGSDSVSKDVTVRSGTALDTLYYVPAAAKASGAAGAFFLTDLDIQNGDDGSATYQFLWLPRGEDNSDPVTSSSFNLAAGAAVRYRDVLGEVFGFDGDAVGALAILSDSRDLTMMSRTYNAPQAGGTFGQALPGYRADQLITTDQRRRILFFTENDEFRSNLGLLNGTGEPIRIMWERFTPDGATVDTGMIDLPPWGNTQLNRVFSDVRPVEAGYIDVWTPTAGGAFAAYGSVLDNQTSDPTTVLPQ